MTTAKPRAGQGEIYAGVWGRTRARTILYACPCGLSYPAEVQVAVNAGQDPALAARFKQGHLNVVRCPACKTEGRAEVPVLYHDEERALFVLVLPPAFRWRELEERAALLLAMAEDPVAAVPSYARDFRVVFGGQAIDALAEARDATPVSVTPPATIGDEGTTGPFDKVEGTDTSAVRRTDPDLRDAGLERWMMSRAPTLHLVSQGRVRLCATLPSARIEPFLSGTLSPRVQLHRTSNYPLIVLAIVRDGADGIEPITFHLDNQRVDDRTVLGALGHAFQFTLDFFDSDYLAVAKRPIEAPLAENVRAIVTAAEVHHASLPVSQRSFEAALAVWHSPTFDRFGRREHNLAEDSFMLLPTPSTARLALGVVRFWAEPEHEDYLLFVRSFPLPFWRRIRSRVLAKCVELGLALPPSLGQLAITEGLARSRKDLAHKLVHHFADLVDTSDANDLDADVTRENWQDLIAACEALGVSLEGRAGDLAAEAVGALPETPAPEPVVRTRPPTHGRAPSVPGTAALGGAAAAPQPAARKLTSPDAVRKPGAGVTGDTGAASTPGTSPPTPRDRLSDRRTPTPIIAGEISARGVPGHKDLGKAPAEELIACLEDKDLRRDAAIDLCRRGDAISVGPVFGALRRMTRGEAVRVLPGVVSFGERAVSHLVDGLRSRKAFLRQGCALALGVLKSADGTEPLCDLLLSEPTDVWREVARAIGEIGAGAIMTLAARVKETAKETNGTNGAGEGDVPREQKRERISWALAHVAARGGRIPVETLAEGRDTMAAQVARRALELTGTARTNDEEVRGGPAPRDQTVNRAFSRRFFEALAGRAPRPLAMELPDALESGEELSLEDAEILMDPGLTGEDAGEEEVLDDEDLIPG